MKLLILVDNTSALHRVMRAERGFTLQPNQLALGVVERIHQRRIDARIEYVALAIECGGCAKPRSCHRRKSRTIHARTGVGAERRTRRPAHGYMRGGGGESTHTMTKCPCQASTLRNVNEMKGRNLQVSEKEVEQ